jgi:cytochrome c oxidase assembly protein subunit 15
VNARIHRFAVLVAVCTLILVFVGGLVTSTDSGLAVPDWPLSYGQVFPPMPGGVFYEHSHRLVAASVGFLTVILAMWLWRKEPRRWVRGLGGLALLTVVCQGVLGGITVLYLLPTAVSVSHAGLAQIFLCLGVSIAVFTSRSWQDEAARIDEEAGVSLRALTVAATAAIYIQTILGALMRHTGSGLAIPDWPLSFGRLIPPHFTPQILVNFTHRTWALVVAGLAGAVVLRVFRRHRAEKLLNRPAGVLLSALITQIFLGGLTVWSGKAVVPSTFHVACGAFTLAASLFLTLYVHRMIPRRALKSLSVGTPSVVTR